MITAKEARELRPRAQLIDRIKDDIDRAIRNDGIAGRQSAEVSALVPNFLAWASGNAARPEYDQLVDDLKKAGFTVSINAGGVAQPRPTMLISWGA